MSDDNSKDQKQVTRRSLLKMVGVGASLTMTGCGPLMGADEQKKELTALQWDEYFKKNYRLMTPEEQKATVERLERIAELRNQQHSQISCQGPLDKILFGYAFNISKCQGYMDCVDACVKENNCDRESGIQYIRLFEMDKGSMSLESANGKYQHDVPAEGKFYMGTQCFHCEKPPCTDVCPTGATWKEKDGIVVVDYDWCIGCRYCEAACPYWGRRFNWKEPTVLKEELNPTQHYLGNRPRKKGVMEKCTWCVQRTRDGKMPACVEACPTGARVFGNLLDPNSEIRKIIANKKVFRMKEELGTEPKFWYYMD
jgi:molybdopterin-containing oxidoreductase family iron-sulfur binding subunit